MPILKNVRRELFCQEMIKPGMEQMTAYKTAGYAGGPASAAQVAQQQEVIDRIAELRQIASVVVATESGITINRVVSELAKVAFAGIDDFMTVGADGQPIHDFSNMTPEKWAAIQEITVESSVVPSGEDDGLGNAVRATVRKIKTKQHPKLQALEMIGKHLGMFPQAGATITNNNTLNVLQVQADERNALASFIAGVQARSPRDSGPEGDQRVAGQPDAGDAPRASLELAVSSPAKAAST